MLLTGTYEHLISSFSLLIVTN